MSLKLCAIPLAAVLLILSAGAWAQSAPPPAPEARPAPKEISPAEHQKHRAEMATGLYAREVGRLAELETQLNLTDKQKPAFEKWKAVKLAAAKARADAFLNEKAPPPAPPSSEAKPPLPNPAEGLQHRGGRLKAELADIKAELPALQALTTVLTPDQMRLLAPPPHHGDGVPMPGLHGGPNGGPDGEPMDPPAHP